MNPVCIKTPFGYVRVTCSDKAIQSVVFGHCTKESELKNLSGIARQAFLQIKAYCDNASLEFNLPLQAEGTPFQQRVWRELIRIPPGKVKTYGDIATLLKTSPRAVGNACRRNPIALVVPCHRVVSRQGIGGYSGETSGQEIRRKQHLLRHEGLEIA